MEEDSVRLHIELRTGRSPRVRNGIAFRDGVTHLPVTHCPGTRSTCILCVGALRFEALSDSGLILPPAMQAPLILATHSFRQRSM